MNTPVCAISSQSGVHLAEQIKRLKELLVGHSVSVVGGTVSANDHPEAKLYCMNFLAKKLVVNLTLIDYYLNNVVLLL